MMSARRNSISEMISWMMHKTEKCIYPGDNTMSCCCKHRNGKIWRLRWWKCIMKPRRHLWMLSTPERREHDRGHNHSLWGNSSIFLQRPGWIWLKVLGDCASQRASLHACVPAHLYYACMSFVSFRWSTGVRRVCPSSMLIMNFWYELHMKF